MNANPEFKVVGSNCLADFLGHANPEDVAKLFEYLADAVSAGEEFENYGGHSITAIGLVDFLGYVAAVIRVDGWLSRTAARKCEGVPASADTAWGTMMEVLSGNKNKVTLTWDVVDGAASYRVYVGTRSLGYDRYYQTAATGVSPVTVQAIPTPLAFGGTPSPGDTARVTITKSDANTFSFTYTVKAGDSLGAIALAVAAGIAGHADNDSHGVTTAPDGVYVNFKAKEVGTPGSSLKYEATATGGLTVTPTGVQSFTLPPTTVSFDLVSVVGTPGAPPVETNVPGDGLLHIATTLAVIMLGKDMPVTFNGVAPGQVGVFRINALVPTDLTPTDLGLGDTDLLGNAELHMVVGAIDSNHVYLPVARPPPPMINLAPATLTFTAQQGGSDPATQTVTITKTGGGVLNWTATVATDSGGEWLSVSPTTGVNNGTLTVTVTLGTLTPGAYTGTITVADDNASNSPQTVKVTLTVTQ